MAAATTAATTGQGGWVIADSAATISAFKNDGTVVDPKEVKRKIHGFEGEGVKAAVDGTAHMWLFDGNDVQAGAGASMPGVAIDGLRKEILSLPMAVKRLGFNCDLRTTGWEGLYRLDHQGKKVDRIPFTYSEKTRLWYVRYTTGESIAKAKAKAIKGSDWESINLFTGSADDSIRELSEQPEGTDRQGEADDFVPAEDRSAITLTSRRRERLLTQMQRHRKLLHLGPCGQGGICYICKQIRGNHRQVYRDGRNTDRPYRNPTVNYSEYAGHKIHMDSAYWDVESIEGSFYTNNGVDDKTGWMHGFHVPTRDVTTVDFFKWVEQHRTNPELNNPNFCKVIVLDPAGEWHVKNTTFMESATLAGIQVVPVHGKSDKRMNSRAEGSILKLKHMVQAGLLDRRLDASWWQRLCDYAWVVNNLYPLQRNAASGLAPLEEMSDGNIARAEIERRIEYLVQPGSLCQVHDPGKHGGAMNVAKSRFGIARRMDGDTAVFENPATGKHEFYSKNFHVLDMRPGLSAHSYLRLPCDPNNKPRACLPADGRPNAEQYHMLALAGLYHGGTADEAMLQGITGPGDALPSCITYDAIGRILAPDENFVMRPTGGLVHIIEADKVSQADRARQRELMSGLRSTHPEWLVGAEAHKRFDEWGGVARGHITAFNREFEGNWTVTYEADGITDEYDSSDILKYVIDTVDGTAADDGGQSLFERYCAGTGDADGDLAAWGDGDANSQAKHIPANFECYITRDGDTWSDVCAGAGIRSRDRRAYFLWLRHFKIGNLKQFRGGDRQADGYVFFPSPFGGKGKGKGTTRFEQGTRFPIPDGVLQSDSKTAQRAADERIEIDTEQAMMDQVMNMVIEAKGRNVTAPGVPAIDPRETVDNNGIPVPPSTMDELDKREFKEMWTAAWKKEWKGLNDHECFLHGLLIQELMDMGIMGGKDGKKVVNSQMLFESKLLDGLFARYKARMVLNGHPGAVRKGIDYLTVFAAAPHLQSQRILRAFEVLLGWTPTDFDIAQAYLLGKAELDQRYPMRYPAGPIREFYRDKKSGKETYALVVGNVYGLPTAGRTYAKERHRLVLVVLPQKTGWTSRKLVREPCMYEIKTDKGLVYMLVHTDDCDLLIQSKDDVERVTKEFNILFGIKGNDGIKVGDGKDMLGIHRTRWVDKGVRYCRLTQSGMIETMWEKFGGERRDSRKRPPSTPFPIDDDHPTLDNQNRVTGVTVEEAKIVHEKGYRQATGSALWPVRCTSPECGYAASVLSKCMSTPPETAWRAAAHVIHWLHAHREEGITFSSHGNLEPVCYYDSGYKQKRLFDKPQYGYIIFWAGCPIIWNSKRHPQIPQSVSQAEYETLTHAWRDVKWVREFLRELGLGKYVEGPTPMIGDNRNARDWATEDVMSDGNRHFEHKYFTIRERVDLGEIMMYWIDGKYNPSDLETKATDKGTTEVHLPVVHGLKEIPLPAGLEVWFGPYSNPVRRGNIAQVAG